MLTISRTKTNQMILGVAFLIVSLLVAACGGGSDDEDSNDPVPVGSYDASVVEQGQRAFSVFCTACHGPDARGVQGLGVNLLESTFFKSHTDEELLAFITQGRPIDHPDNTTGVEMPPRGGYPNLTDEQISAIIAFLRTTIAAG